MSFPALFHHESRHRDRANSHKSTKSTASTTSPKVGSSPASAPKSPHIEIASKLPTRPRRTNSQRHPPTVLFQGPSFYNGTSPEDGDQHGEQHEAPQQRLPRAGPPPSLSGPSVRPRPDQSEGQTGGRNSRYMSVFSNQNVNNDTVDEFRADALWAEMQKTLADVELSAMNTTSSHIFGASHSRALENLRATQLALANTWARSEADEIVGHDSATESENEDDFVIKSATFMSNNHSPRKAMKDAYHDRRRSSGASSVGAKDLEAETERDIQLARKRREANDRYFQQVNKGVLDVVARLDDVANAMRKVERESRDIWDDRSTTSTVATENIGLERQERPRHKGESNDDDDEEYEIDDDDEVLTRTTLGSGTEDLSDSPVTPKKKAR